MTDPGTENTTTNHLDSTIQALFVRLNELNGHLEILRQFLENFKLRYKQSIKKSNFLESSLYAGSALAIRDLTEFPDDNWARHYLSGVFVAQGEQILKLPEEFQSHYAAWTVQQGFEAFEKHLKRSLLQYLQRFPESVGPNKIANTQKNTAGKLRPMIITEQTRRNYN